MSDIDRSRINLQDYNAKFVFVDRVLALKKPHPKYWLRIAADPTMKAYAFLRLDGNPLKLYPYQDVIINDSHRFKYFRAANQIGKSLYLDVDAVIEFITDHNHAFNSAIVSKSLPQSLHQMRRIKSLLNSMVGISWAEDKGSSDNMGIITLDIKGDSGKVKYTNIIICAPCTEGLLGYDLHKLYLDEFEFWEEDIKYFFNQIAQPRTYHTKGGIIITTNPNGADNFGAELERQTLSDGSRKWHVYCFNYLDKPGNTLAEYEELRRELPRSEFESTVAAIRTESDKSFFSRDEVEGSEDKKLSDISMVGQQPFFFLDVGAKKDHCVLTGGFIVPDEVNPKFKHLFVPIIHQYPAGYPLSMVVGVEDDGTVTSGWHHEKSVKGYLDEWGAGGVMPIVGVDVTGNSGIAPLMRAAGINPVDIVFSGPAKSGMYQRFKYYMEKHLLHRIPSKAFDYEASHLQVKKSIRGYLMIHHEREEDHDDVMDSVCGLIHLSDNPKIFPPSVTFVNQAEKVVGDNTPPPSSSIREAYIARIVADNNNFSKKSYGGFSYEGRY